MIKITFAFLLLISFLVNDAVGGPPVAVRGYYRSNGTYVPPHYRSAPDGSVYNNYSTKGNQNPYTGKSGTVNPYSGGAIVTPYS